MPLRLVLPFALFTLLSGCGSDGAETGGSGASGAGTGGAGAAGSGGSGGSASGSGGSASGSGGSGGSASGSGGSASGSGGSGGSASGSGGSGGGVAGGTPGELALADEELAKGWYQYYEGSTQYRPAGEAFDLALDGQGRPRVVHVAGYAPAISVLEATPQGWKADSKVTDPDFGYTLYSVAIASGPDDHPRVAVGGLYYVSYPNSLVGVHHYAFDGYKWLDDHPVPAAGSSTPLPRSVSLAIDAAGKPHVAFVGDDPEVDGQARRFVYARLEGGKWFFDTIDDVDPAIDTFGEDGIELRLDAKGAPHVAYTYKRQGGSGQDSELILGYARRDSSGWKREIAEDYLWLRAPIAMALGPDGEPRVAFADDKYPSLWVTTRKDGVWSREKVDEQGDVGWGHAIDVDAAGRPHVSYVDRATNQLRYARKLASGWDVYRPAESYSAGQTSTAYTTPLRTDLALGPDGLPHIVVGGFNLHYVHGTPSP